MCQKQKLPQGSHKNWIECMVCTITMVLTIHLHIQYTGSLINERFFVLRGAWIVYPMLMCLSSRTHWMRTTSSGACAARGPHPMVKSFISLMDCFSATMDSGVIWTIRPSSTMLDLALSPELGFNAPLNTTKLAPVTIKQ